jgi:hypothetical protein
MPGRSTTGGSGRAYVLSHRKRVRGRGQYASTWQASGAAFEKQKSDTSHFAFKSLLNSPTVFAAPALS